MCDDPKVQIKQWAAEQWMGEALKLRKERDEQKEDIRFLLKLVPAPPWPGVPVENEGKVIESLIKVREKVR